MMSSIEVPPESSTSVRSYFHPKCLIMKGECQYTQYFCEENVWLMIKRINYKSPARLKFCYPIFISNHYAQIPLWKQSASCAEDGFVVWDYHVIMVYCEEKESWFFDYDSQLSFPTEFREYCEETFRTQEHFYPVYHRLFRVLSAESYLKYFSSDHRHMKNGNGTWKKPPPNYPALINSEKEHNLGNYISMTKDTDQVKFGYILNLKEFVQKFSNEEQS